MAKKKNAKHKKQLLKKKKIQLNDDDQSSKKTNEAPRFISSLSKDQLQSEGHKNKALTDGKEKGKRIIKAIPLIKKNNYIANIAENGGVVEDGAEKSSNSNPTKEGDGKNKSKGKGNSNGMSKDDNFNDEAANALLAEVNETGTKEKKDIDAIPLLLQNVVPGTESMKEGEEKFLTDVKSRPEKPDLDAYDRVPVEDIGIGLLMGMGWKPGQVRHNRHSHIPLHIYLSMTDLWRRASVRAQHSALSICDRVIGMVYVCSQITLRIRGVCVLTGSVATVLYHARIRT